MKESIIELLNRDLSRLSKEIDAYSDEKLLWHVEKEISNSAGNLALHIIGNLNHFVGAILGKSGYIRQREKEFNDKNVPREKMQKDISVLQDLLNDVIGGLTNEELNSTYPLNLFKKEMTVQFFLIHLYGHLNYHLGQINYHRRLIA